MRRTGTEAVSDLGNDRGTAIREGGEREGDGQESTVTPSCSVRTLEYLTRDRLLKPSSCKSNVCAEVFNHWLLLVQSVVPV